MFKSIRLGTVLGIPVTVHWTLLVLSAWLAASDYRTDGAAAAAASTMLIVSVFACILAHEFGHILVARSYGIVTRSINLSPLGGIAFLDSYPERPGARALIALGGPAVSVVLALVFFVWSILGYGEEGLHTLVGKLFIVNTIIVLFNMLPIYPMDGGQVLNAAVTKIGGKQAASWVSLYIGQTASLAMIGVGAWLVSLSLILIGAFIFLAVSFEFDSPVLGYIGIKRRRTRSQASTEKSGTSYLEREILGAPNGIFVAFDADGRHFAYARHWNDIIGFEEEQKETVAEYEQEARAKGGEIRLLTLDEYQRVVLARE